MPSQAMQDVIDVLRERQKASASQAPPTLEQRRAAFAPAGRLYPVPDDVLVTEVSAGGVPAHWLAAPGADAGRVLLFLHGGGYELGSLRSDGELAGLPPLLIQVGTADLLLSDSERLAAAAAQAGVDVTLEIGEGLPHVYPILLGTPEAAEATEQTGKFLRARVR
jgi:acetyl esterase/lipase